MSSRASIRKHPIHPMLVVFPIGLWIFSLVCDVIYTAGSQDQLWKTMAFYTMLGGVVGALMAAIPGFIDYLTIQDRRVKRIATFHLILNLVAVVLFIFNLGLRYRADPETDTIGTILSVAAIALMAVSGWLGGSLVYVHRVGVQPARESVDQERRAA